MTDEREVYALDLLCWSRSLGEHGLSFEEWSGRQGAPLSEPGDAAEALSCVTAVALRGATPSPGSLSDPSSRRTGRADVTRSPIEAVRPLAVPLDGSLSAC